MDTELGQQQEGGQQGAENGTCGVGRIEAAPGARHPVTGRAQGPHQDRQGSPHQHGGQADQHEGQHPGEQAQTGLQTSERLGHVGEGQGGSNAEQCHGQLEPGVEAHRIL
ncbi:hypothetical protein D3C86_1083050 [compost metagenome]